jgi:hypothetical protein
VAVAGGGVVAGVEVALPPPLRPRYDELAAVVVVVVLLLSYDGCCEEDDEDELDDGILCTCDSIIRISPIAFQSAPPPDVVPVAVDDLNS